MKTLKQLREDYDPSVYVPEELILEQRSTNPSPKDLPSVLVFRRISIKLFPNKQVVALYYSKLIDKYLSIPYGHDNVNLDEAVWIEPEELTEDWSKINRRDNTSGMSQKAVNAYRRENPGSKLQTAVTEKNPSGKRAARRKSFCSRMGGMKKRLTSAKTANDPDSRINKALRRWNCHENVQSQTLKEFDALDAATMLPGSAGNWASAASAGRNILRGRYVDAAIDAAGAVDPSKVLTGVGASGLLKGAKAAKAASEGVAGASKLVSGMSQAGRAAAKGSAKDLVTGMSQAGHAAADAKKASTRGRDFLKAAGKKVIGNLAKSGDNTNTAPSQNNDPATTPRNIEVNKPRVQMKSSFDSEPARTSSQVDRARAKNTNMAQAKYFSQPSKVQENKIADLRKFIKEDNAVALDLVINEKTVTLNKGMAKRIVSLYESLNIKNKKMVEGMLNEDLDTFKNLLNFSIKS